MVEMGMFKCFSYFITVTFYFVKLNNLLLHIRTILWFVLLIVMEN